MERGRRGDGELGPGWKTQPSPEACPPLQSSRFSFGCPHPCAESVGKGQGWSDEAAQQEGKVHFFGASHPSGPGKGAHCCTLGLPEYLSQPSRQAVMTQLGPSFPTQANQAARWPKATAGGLTPPPGLGTIWPGGTARVWHPPPPPACRSSRPGQSTCTHTSSRQKHLRAR